MRKVVKIGNLATPGGGFLNKKLQVRQHLPRGRTNKGKNNQPFSFIYPLIGTKKTEHQAVPCF